MRASAAPPIRRALARNYRRRIGKGQKCRVRVLASGRTDPRQGKWRCTTCAHDRSAQKAAAHQKKAASTQLGPISEAVTQSQASAAIEVVDADCLDPSHHDADCNRLPTDAP